MRFIGSLIMALLMSFGAIGQINFFKLYTDGGDDEGHGIVQLEDSSYVITGTSSSFLGAGSEAFLLAIDSLGNYQWSNHYGGTESEVGKRVMYQPNVGFFIAGFTNSIGAGAYDYYLVKTDVSGNEEWSKAYGGEGWDRVHDAALTRDTGVIMVGENGSTTNGDSDAHIIRTDINGDVVWEHTLSSAGNDTYRTIHQWDDSTFFVGADVYNEDSSLTKIVMQKIHDNGTVYWTDTIGAHGNYRIYDITDNGTELWCVGYRDGDASDGEDEYYFKVNPDTGVKTWDWTLISSGDRRAVVLTTYESDPTKVYMGFNYFDQWSFPDAPDLAIDRFSSDFGWEARGYAVAYPGHDEAHHLIPTSDGGAIGVGVTNSEGIGLHHIFVGKIGPGESYPFFQAPHDSEQLVALNEISIENSIKVYPNPATDIAYISLDTEEEVTLNLLDASGRVVATDLFYGTTYIDATDLLSGVYYAHLEVNGATTVRKVIVQH